jgi:hypothetical protein
MVQLQTILLQIQFITEVVQIYACFVIFAVYAVLGLGILNVQFVEMAITNGPTIQYVMIYVLLANILHSTLVILLIKHDATIVVQIV